MKTKKKKKWTRMQNLKRKATNKENKKNQIYTKYKIK